MFSYRLLEPEYWLRLAGHFTLVVAAGLAVRTGWRDGAVRLVPRLPGHALTWMVVVLGLAGTAALFGELWQVSHLEYLSFGELPVDEELAARNVATLVATATTPFW